MSPTPSLANEVGKALVAKPDKLTSVPRTHRTERKEQTSSHKLSLNPHMPTVALT